MRVCAGVAAGEQAGGCGGGECCGDARLSLTFAEAPSALRATVYRADKRVATSFQGVTTPLVRGSDACKGVATLLVMGGWSVFAQVSLPVNRLVDAVVGSAAGMRVSLTSVDGTSHEVRPLCVDVAAR
jgi:hypothetical protein